MISTIQLLGVLATLVGAILTGVAAIARLWIRPIEIRLDHLSFSIDRETRELRQRFESIENQQRNHTEDEERHVTADWRRDTLHWRTELLARFDRLEDRLDGFRK